MSDAIACLPNLAIDSCDPLDELVGVVNDLLNTGTLTNEGLPPILQINPSAPNNAPVSQTS